MNSFFRPFKHSARARSESAFTFAEVLVTVGIVTAFLSTAFLVNARLLQNLKAQKETIGATQSFQERMEQIRSISFSNVADATYLQNNIFNADTLSSAAIPGAAEQVTVSVYPDDGLTPIQMTRQNGVLTVNSSSVKLA